MKKNLTITIGIPAYNEEANISNLLHDLFMQKFDNFVLSQIIISSDGSTDRTNKIIKNLKNRNVKLIVNKTRIGIARGLNQIIKASNTDILILLDADIRIIDKYFIKKLIEPIVKTQADLTSSKIKPLDPKNFFSKILAVSMLYKSIIFINVNNGNNVYTCYGLARGLSKRFYKKLKFPVSIGNDMYSYLACKKKNFNFINVSSAIAYYRLPDNFNDHKKQSQRFYFTENEQEKLFDKNFVKSQTHIPFSAYLDSIGNLSQILIKYPILTFAYLSILFYIKLSKKPENAKNQKWDIAKSSKNLSII